MSELDYRPEPDDEIEDPEFEAALRARRRRRWIVSGAGLVSIGLLLGVPWREAVQSSGRVAPERWARVRSEAPGVVRDVHRRSGDAVREGDVIAVLDSDEQYDALETARHSLARERQKLADLEIRLRENRILREGADAALREVERRGLAGARIEASRVEALEPAATAVLEGVRDFATRARGDLAMDRAARASAPFRGEPLQRKVQAAMARYVEQVDGVAEHIGEAVGQDSRGELRFALDGLRFSFALAERSMQEIVLKHELVAQDILAPVALRELVLQLEREAMDLAQGFRSLAANARGRIGSPAQREELLRGAEENRRLLANEAERLEAERTGLESGIAQAELAVRAAERHQGKTAIRAPIDGTLSETALAEFDGVGANAAVGVVENLDRLVLKVLVAEADWTKVEEGQAVSAEGRGQTLRGRVVWKVPLPGQEVRDQEWNVLVQLDQSPAETPPGTKVQASVQLGRRNLFQRLLERGAREVPPEPRVAFVEDPTEQRAPDAERNVAARDPAAEPAPEPGLLETAAGGG